MSDNIFQYVPWEKELLAKAGCSASTDSVMLDFGCGVGECVDQFRKAGYPIFGCDIAFPDDPDSRLKSYQEQGIIRKIENHPYHIPFEDNFFDIVFSNQVFEHVMDYPSTLAEINRILKADGMSVHVFPGCWKIKESHVYVPFSSVIKSFWWLYFWAWRGIRNEYQQGLSARETAESNYRYLHQQTNYLPRRKIRKYVTQYFDYCRFVEEAYFYISPRFKTYAQKFPFLLMLYRAWFSDTEMRVLVFGKKK